MRKHISILLALFMVLTFAVACSPKKLPSDDVNPPSNNPVDPGNNEDEEDVLTESQEVTLYFANKKYADTGDESLEKLIAEKRNIKYKDISLEEAIIRELMKGPEDEENLYTEIPSTAKLIDVKVDDGIASVNFASEGMNGGSMQEAFTINQIVASYLELDNIDKIQFLLDGEKAESLMGHYGIDQPFDEVTF